MTRAEMQNEIDNVESMISQFLPAEYLDRIGAGAEAPNGYKRALHLRCLRIFDDLADRLAAQARQPKFAWRSMETDPPTSAGFQVWVAYRNPNHPLGWNIVVEFTPVAPLTRHLTPEPEWWQPMVDPEPPPMPTKGE